MNIERESMKRIFIILAVAFAVTAYSQTTTSRIGAENAEESESNALWPPEKIMDIGGLGPGMTVAEIGAGRGRTIVFMAERVGKLGKVYAEDISTEDLQFLAERCRRAGFGNVETILGDSIDPKLPAGTLDVIFVINAYHHFNDPIALMRKARVALKPSGRLVVVEWVKPASGRGEGTSPETIKAQMEEAGFVLDRMEKPLPAPQISVSHFNLRKS